MFRKFLFVLMCLLWVGTARAQAEDGEKQKALSPYFYVAGGDPNVDRLPLKSLSAEIRISGSVAAVRISQIFENHAQKPIEAVYVFPASTGAAVHGMRMRIGNRVVDAHIDRKQKARQEYEAAKKEGKRASLLEQHRPNVFSTSVANIMPGDVIAVELDYSELLVPDDHVYELAFPAVVGPRYAGGMDTQKDIWVGTPYLSEGKPETYSYSINAHLQTGVALQEVVSPSHEIVVERRNASTADVRLKNSGGGNRDLILRYRLAGDAVQTGLLLSPPTANDGVGHFALMMEPPARVQPKDIPAREYIFLVDVSGSMSGFPLDTAKSLMRDLAGVLRPSDCFNLVLFAGASATLWQKSRPANGQNLSEMQAYLEKQQAGGGTELMGGLHNAYAIARDPATLSRAVVLITDGYVGVEAETFRFVREHLADTNLFAFGIGSSVNRALMEGVARAGLGEPFTVTKPEQGSAVAARFRLYIDSPVLAKIKVNFPGFDVFDVLPSAVPDLMSSRPLVVLGKYRGEPRGQVVVTGRTGGGAFQRTLPVVPTTDGSDNAVLAKLWARKRAAQIEDELAFGGDQSLRITLADIGLRYSVLTEETSFVAIDRVVANATGDLAKSKQPLPLPEGVSNLAVGSEVELSRSEMPPGDPIVTVAAPANARKVTAYFPFGLVKDLTFDPSTKVWQTRFLVPKTVPDGIYEVPVVILHANGHFERIVATYRIDSVEPDFVTTLTPTKGGVAILVQAQESLREVVAYEPQTQRRVYLSPTTDGLTFTGIITLPKGRHLLRLVGSDKARNEAEEIVATEVQ